MKASEKAFEITNKISIEFDEMPYSYCKALAKLTVDLIIQEATDYFKRNLNDQYWFAEADFWEQVKEEINNL